MKRLKLLSVFVLPMFIASCDSDEAGSAPIDENAIRFTAVARHEARGDEVTTNTLKKFNVFAYTGGKVYMDNVKVSKDADNTWTYSPVMYWPATPVNFFAFSPADWFDGVSGVDQAVTYTSDGNVDLIYAVNMDETQSASPVNLNFRHAMSHVEVQLMSTTSNIVVNLHGLKLNNVFKTGTFTFPQVTTTPGVGTTAGVWSKTADPGEYVLYDGASVALSASATEYSENCDGFLLPQNLTDMAADASGYTGSYVSVDCTIADKATGTLLWPNDKTPVTQVVSNGEAKIGRLFFPLRNTTVTHWRGGYRYLYVITINNAEGMEPIDFDPAVEVYVEETSQL